MLPAESSTFTKVLKLQSALRHRMGPIRRRLLRIKEAEKYGQGNAAGHQWDDTGSRPPASGGSGVFTGTAVGSAGTQTYGSGAAARGPAGAAERATATDSSAASVAAARGL